MLRNKIREVIESKGWSINALAEELGMVYKNVHQLVSREFLDDTKLSTLADVAKILHVNIIDLYEKEGEMVKMQQVIQDTTLELEFDGILIEEKLITDDFQTMYKHIGNGLSSEYQIRYVVKKQKWNVNGYILEFNVIDRHRDDGIYTTQSCDKLVDMIAKEDKTKEDLKIIFNAREYNAKSLQSK